MPRSTITYQLAKDLKRILQAELETQDYDENRLALAILLMLSRRPYPDHLLFRDFGRTEAELWLKPARDGTRVYQPGQIYLSSILSRPLTLANNLREKPTNMHVLHLALARLGPRVDDWPCAQVARTQRGPTELAARPPGPSFLRVEGVLAAQVARLGRRYGEISRKRRDYFGPIWLSLGENAAEMAEEMSLWNVFAATPLPLEGPLDDEILLVLLRVVESLNERYSLLRSCGLDPEDWLDAGDLSIARLKDLKCLRMRAEALLRSGEISGNEPRVEAYRRAFATCRGSSKRLAGYASFATLCEDHRIGGRFLDRARSLDEPVKGPDGDAMSLVDAIADPSAESPQAQAEYQDRLLRLLQDCPFLAADPVLAYFAAATLVKGHPIHDDGSGQGLLADAEFRRLVDSATRYPATDDAVLLTTIESNLREALRSCASLVA